MKNLMRVLCLSLVLGAGSPGMAMEQNDAEANLIRLFAQTNMPDDNNRVYRQTLQEFFIDDNDTINSRVWKINDPAVKEGAYGMDGDLAFGLDKDYYYRFERLEKRDEPIP